MNNLTETKLATALDKIDELSKNQPHPTSEAAATNRAALLEIAVLVYGAFRALSTGREIVEEKPLPAKTKWVCVWEYEKDGFWYAYPKFMDGHEAALEFSHLIYRKAMDCKIEVQDE